MIIAHEDKCPTLEVQAPCRRTLKVLLSPVLHPSLKLLAVGQSILPPGGKSDDHAHAEGEMFYALAGTGRLKTSSGEALLTPGTAIWSPPGESHQLINDGKETLKILWVLSPPGREASIVEKAS